MKNEFEDFIDSSHNIMPKSIEESIRISMHKKLSPSFTHVLMKVSMMQVFSGLILIAICPQLGVGFFESSVLMNFFMQFGHNVCTFLCGSLFLSLGVLANRLFLSAEEWQRYSLHAFKFQAMVVGFSIFSLLLLGADTQLFLITLWCVGGLVTSLSLIKLIFRGAVPNNLAL